MRSNAYVNVLDLRKNEVFLRIVSHDSLINNLLSGTQAKVAEKEDKTAV